jgi:hypothetical protein
MIDHQKVVICGSCVARCRFQDHVGPAGAGWLLETNLGPSSSGGVHRILLESIMASASVSIATSSERSPDGTALKHQPREYGSLDTADPYSGISWDSEQRYNGKMYHPVEPDTLEELLQLIKVMAPTLKATFLHALQPASGRACLAWQHVLPMHWLPLYVW